MQSVHARVIRHNQWLKDDALCQGGHGTSLQSSALVARDPTARPNERAAQWAQRYRLRARATDSLHLLQHAKSTKPPFLGATRRWVVTAGLGFVRKNRFRRLFS